MFSGIVEAVGKIAAAQERKGGVRFSIEAPSISGELNPGESVCVSGACLTTVSRNPVSFDVELVPETIRRTAKGRFATGSRVNLERSVRLSERLGGHLVSGHVDGVGKVTGRINEGQGIRLSIEVPEPLRRYLVFKGSVAVDGVSLTVAAVSKTGLEVALIPYTLDHTTLSEVVKGSEVNLEMDLIGKYVERLLSEGGRIQPAGRARKRP
jgi:riboflavin synthase